MKLIIEEFNKMGFEVLFFRDDFAHHCEILKNDLYVLSIKAGTMDDLESGMNDLLNEVKSMKK